VVEIGRKAAEIKTSQDAAKLQQNLDAFVQPRKIQQEQRIEKIEKVARVLYGGYIFLIKMYYNSLSTSSLFILVKV